MIKVIRSDFEVTARTRNVYIWVWTKEARFAYDAITNVHFITSGTLLRNDVSYEPIYSYMLLFKWINLDLVTTTITSLSYTNNILEFILI